MLRYIYPDLPLFLSIMGSLLTSLLLVLIFCSKFIKLVEGFAQPIREDGPASHLSKKRTATFGGVLIIIASLFSTILWVRFNLLTVAVLGCGLAFGVLGFADDFLKLKHNNSNKGLSARFRLLVGFALGLGLLAVVYHIYPKGYEFTVYWPFIKGFLIPISLIYFIWVPFVVAGTSNAVNLTDGLDGLLSLVGSVVILGLAFIVWYISSSHLSSLCFPQILLNNAEEVVIILVALVGSLVGFLWVNSYPAQIFMGDVGSLFIGGIIASVVIIFKQELFLLVAGFIFVAEAISVILQVASYKIIKRRVFLMAPLHHHFEQNGIAETKIVMRFFVITIVLTFIAVILVIL